MSDLVQFEHEAEPLEVKTSVSIGTSDVVNLLVLQFIEKNYNDQQKLIARIDSFNAERNTHILSIHEGLIRSGLRKMGSKFEALFASIANLGGSTYRMFATEKEAREALGSNRADENKSEQREADEMQDEEYHEEGEEPSFDRIYVDHYVVEDILALAGVRRRTHDRYYDDRKVINWSGVPKTWLAIPLVYKIHDSGYHRSHFYDVLGGNNSARILPDSIFEVDVPEELHSKILRVRHLEAHSIKLQKELNKLRKLVADEDALRARISAQLTYSLLAESGMDVDIKRVWASMSISVSDAIALALPKEEENKYGPKFDKSFNPDDFEDLEKDKK